MLASSDSITNDAMNGFKQQCRRRVAAERHMDFPLLPTYSSNSVCQFMA
jgi:hypothetical protein